MGSWAVHVDSRPSSFDSNRFWNRQPWIEIFSSLIFIILSNDMSVRLKAYVHVVPVTWWICWICLLHSQHVSAPSVGQTNMDGNKLSSSTFYSEVHFEYHMTGESRPSSSFFKFFPDFGWFSRFLRFFTLAHLTAAKCSIRMIPDSFRSIRTRDWRTSRTTPVAGAGLLYSWILINEI